jgi:DeoD family purine-nucleoside phosphorylase
MGAAVYVAVRASATIHLRPHAEVAERVLLPGDPGRALRLAQQLLDAPKMLNHNRGLWGYSGAAADGEPLTIQSTGIGGPSAAIVVEELVALGARRLLRVGTCGTLAGELELGRLVIADGVLAEDGASRALGATGTLRPDPVLQAALRTAAGADAAAGLVVSADLFYDPDLERAARWTDAGALAVEMEAATLLAVAGRHGAAAACLLAVSDVVADGTRIGAEALEHAEHELGRIGAAALAG